MNRSIQNRPELEVADEEVVAKANRLIRARHDFTTYEQRIFAAMVAQLDRDAEQFDEQEIPVSRICPSAEPGYIYQKIDCITDRLLHRDVHVRRTDAEGEEVGFKKINVLSSCEYNKNEGVLRARFTADMRPLLLRLKKRFTLYLLAVFLRLESKYSTQIYELLKMRQGLCRLCLTVEEFRRTLGLEDKYARFSSLKKRVIEQARTELKEKADIYFTCDVRRGGKSGRAPKEITFYIRENEDVIQELEEETSEMATEHLSLGKERARSNSSSEPGKETVGEPDIDPKSMFLGHLTQEELDATSREEVDRLYRRAREEAQENNPDRDSKTVIASETLRIMKRLYRDGSSSD